MRGASLLRARTHLVEHVIQHPGVLGLRAEQDDLRVLSAAHAVPRGPEEELTAADHFLVATGIGDGELALDQVAPVRRVAQVALQALEEWRDVGTGREREVLAA